MSNYFFRTGNVVKWKDELYIVSNYNNEIDSLELIDFSHPNCMCYPSKTWPSAETGIEAVKLVSESMDGYLNKLFKRMKTECVNEEERIRPVVRKSEQRKNKNLVLRNN